VGYHERPPTKPSAPKPDPGCPTSQLKYLCLGGLGTVK
jgi:hypothetical protein